MQREPACFPDATSLPRIVVYGSMHDWLPRFDVTPALERWLYGPNDFGKTNLRNPQGMTLLGEQLLVCDQGSPDVIAIHLHSGRSLPWTNADYPPRCPVDISADETGRVYVADTTMQSVLVYDSNGRFLQELVPSSDPAQTFRPCAVLVTDHVLHIGNLGGYRVDRYDVNRGTWLSPLRPPRDSLSLIAPTGLSITPDGVLLIADALQSCVFRVDSDGQWLTPIGRPGREPGEFVRPKQVCCTPSGLMLVSDAGRQSVLVFDVRGRYVTEIHERADGWPGLTLPMGLLAVPSDRLVGPEENIANGAVRTAVIVSDSLGGTPLTLMGIVVDDVEASADAH
jgi:DNA-binding beta-propeller fold protein YncE